MQIECFGAVGEVTGSCHLLTVAGQRILIDCGLFQGGRDAEVRNFAPFPFDPFTLDAVILSHAHIDHSGRVPLLVKAGFHGPIHTHYASLDLCTVMLRDAAFIHEKEVEWENRKRERRGLKLLKPVYDREDAQRAMRNFEAQAYGEAREILPGVVLTLHDAGHILGSAIVQLDLTEGDRVCRLIFSGDLGQAEVDILPDPTLIETADMVLLESTYGDRCHRSHADTLAEMQEVLARALHGHGNVLIPAFAVGRTQELL
jgi:metallo-beta-lactamase family protein